MHILLRLEAGVWKKDFLIRKADGGYCWVGGKKRKTSLVLVLGFWGKEVDLLSWVRDLVL